MPVPSSYVPGLGQGSGSDIGPARELPPEETIVVAQTRRGEQPYYDPDVFEDPDTQSSLFAGVDYGADDDAVDEIFEKIDARWEARMGESACNLPKRRKVKETRSYAIPDSILLGERNKSTFESSLSNEQWPCFQHVEFWLADTPNIADLATTRGEILSLKLDQAAGGSTSINSKEYLSDLDNTVLRTDPEIGDIKPDFYSNPWSSPTPAGIEEHAGNIVAARKLITAGCQQCPTNEIWIETARLHTIKIILGSAIQHVRHTAELEAGTDADGRVLRKALESIPTSVQVWKETVNLETSISAADTQLLLARARAVELILQLKPFEQAKAVLIKAGTANPTGAEVRIAAAHLLETSDSANRVCCLQWLQEAERSDELGLPRTCGVIPFQWISSPKIKSPLGSELLRDVGAALSRSRFATARAIVAYTLKPFLIASSMEVLFEQAATCYHLAELIWLMWANYKQADGGISTACQVLEGALNANNNSERIWLATVKLEADRGMIDVARALLLHARDGVNAERAQLWMESAVFERQHGSLEDALSTGLSRCDRHRLMTVSAEFQLPGRHFLWASKEKNGKSIKARSLLEKPRLVLSDDELVWAEAVYFEPRSGAMPNSHVFQDRDLGTSDGKFALELFCSSLGTAFPFKVISPGKAVKDWFGHAAAASPDIGDIWAWWPKFEREYGTEDQRSGVISSCTKHGRIWELSPRMTRISSRRRHKFLTLCQLC
ncbi:hypothetical protein C8F04DRAFT_1314355 [Mycena alexandri]|uniref:PRP1 splicing factor N-terminal domain-containing protein n=1 Tax=Mycena alexandri TaxID=1745969 RepID=A0AAD6S5E5_9AGAR|nr:hypothetical protein C8F04DRAFT_1314355 [Mycena alexandri]